MSHLSQVQCAKNSSLSAAMPGPADSVASSHVSHPSAARKTAHNRVPDPARCAPEIF